MPAYLLLTLAVLSRLLPSLAHTVGRNLTLTGASLLYFGARRLRREFVLAALAFAATDLALTTVAFRLPFHPADYTLTFLWYLGVPFVGRALLRAPRARVRVTVVPPGETPAEAAARRYRTSRRAQLLRTALGTAAATLTSATSFFLLSNGQVWAQSRMYPRTAAGLAACYAAGLPFYRNDLLSTGLTLAVLVALPALTRARSSHHATPARA